MKYKMLKDLPFIKTGEVFGKGCWAGGGWGVDLGRTEYKGGGGADNGTKVFEEHENKLLDSLLLNKDWIKMIPNDEGEALNLYEENYMRKDEFLEMIKLTPKGKL